MALLGLGIGMIISALTTRYRDLAFLVAFGVQLLMHATTVDLPLSTVLVKFTHHPWMSAFIEYNPMTPIIETFRIGFLGNGTFTWPLFASSVVATLIILFLGIFIFNKVEKNFVDTI